jgi:hypothetical protein
MSNNSRDREPLTPFSIITQEGKMVKDFFKGFADGTIFLMIFLCLSVIVYG